MPLSAKLRPYSSKTFLQTNGRKMRNAELKIITSDIPQLAESVAARRMENLTGYPLARLCEWSAPRRQQRLDSSENAKDESQD